MLKRWLDAGVAVFLWYARPDALTESDYQMLNKRRPGDINVLGGLQDRVFFAANRVTCLQLADDVL